MINADRKELAYLISHVNMNSREAEKIAAALMKKYVLIERDAVLFESDDPRPRPLVTLYDLIDEVERRGPLKLKP